MAKHRIMATEPFEKLCNFFLFFVFLLLLLCVFFKLVGDFTSVIFAKVCGESIKHMVLLCQQNKQMPAAQMPWCLYFSLILFTATAALLPIFTIAWRSVDENDACREAGKVGVAHIRQANRLQGLKDEIFFQSCEKNHLFFPFQNVGIENIGAHLTCEICFLFLTKIYAKQDGICNQRKVVNNQTVNSFPSFLLLQ